MSLTTVNTAMLNGAMNSQEENSPTFTGNPTAPTPLASDNSTTIATTAFVHTNLSNALVSPNFTGSPTAPTASSGTNSTQIATTAFVVTAVASAVPAGTVIMWSGPAAPTGYMQCPTSAGGSQLVSRATFAALFVALGTTWGAGDGSTTFGIPWFPSGYGGVHNTSGVSTQTTGSVISHTHTTAAAAANLGTESATHTHSFNPTNSGSASGTSYYGAYTGIPDGTGQTGTQSADHTHYDAGHAHSVNATGGTANVPAGVQLMFCVKY